MTTKERQQVRQNLIDAGFRRISSTQDKGDGRYVEQWQSDKDNSVIELKWDKKTLDKKAAIAEIIDEFEQVASSAVQYVGMANYAEREQESLAKVAAAADTARKALLALMI